MHRPALTALIAAAVVAGCGDSGDRGALSRSDYQAAVQKIVQGQSAMRADRLFLKLVVDEPRLAQDECAQTAREFERTLRRIVDQVDRLRPPPAVADLQKEFVAAARQSVDAVSEAARDVETGAVRCGSPLNRRIYGLPSTERAERVLERFRQRGYDFGFGE